MKKLALILMIALSVQCAYPANTTLDKIEKSLYGFTYSNDSDTARLNRIEEKVYGKTSSGQVNSRIAKLKTDLSADLIGQEISPCEDTFKQEDDDYIVFEKEPQEAATMDYPVIDELERSVFKKEFKTQNIRQRLSNLEQKTFNKTYDKEDLSTRVDRLRAQIKPQSFAQNGMQQQENSFYSDSVDKMAQNYHLNQYGAPFEYDSFNNNSYSSYDEDDDIPEPNVFKQNSRPLNISTIEKKLYHKKFEDQPMSERLTRIESSIFGTSFPKDNESERIQRISSAIQAQKTAKRYDSNRINQNIATAVQIGTLILMVLACIL